MICLNFDLLSSLIIQKKAFVYCYGGTIASIIQMLLEIRDRNHNEILIHGESHTMLSTSRHDKNIYIIVQKPE